MKKNFLFSGIKGEGLKGFTGKKSYNVDRVNCNEHSTYIEWVEWADDDDECVNCSVSLAELLEAYFEKLERENG